MKIAIGTTVRTFVKIRTLTYFSKRSAQTMCEIMRSTPSKLLSRVPLIRCLSFLLSFYFRVQNKYFRLFFYCHCTFNKIKASCSEAFVDGLQKMGCVGVTVSLLGPMSIDFDAVPNHWAMFTFSFSISRILV